MEWRPQPAGFERRAEAVLERRDDGGLLRDRSGPQRRSKYLEMAAQDGRQIDFGLRAFHQTDQNQPSTIGECLKILCEVGRADAVEDQVRTAIVGGGLDLRCEWPRGIVD